MFSTSKYEPNLMMTIVQLYFQSMSNDLVNMIAPQEFLQFEMGCLDPPDF